MNSLIINNSILAEKPISAEYQLDEDLLTLSPPATCLFKVTLL